MSAIASSPQDQRLAVALMVAAALHSLLILGVGFDFAPPSPDTLPQPLLEVVLVNRPSPPAPEAVEQPDFLAQASVEGSGDEPVAETVPSASDPPPVPGPEPLTVATETAVESPPAPEIAPEPVEAPPTERPDSRETELTTEKADAPEPPKPVIPRTAPRRKVTAAQILASRGTEIAEVTARLDRKAEAYAQRERRKAISASTREYKYAAYLDAWRRKVERIGNLNYPEEAKRRRLYGNLVLHVAVRSDGSVEKVRVVHSSGYPVLDDAALRIVKLAAPFAPFPADIRAETDVLDITRTWQFLSSNRLGWDQ